MRAAPGTALSVIVPAYLSHTTIEQCLRSLAAQSYPHREVIVVDSSPDDRTTRAVERFGPGVKLVRSEPRLLPHAARNRGAEHATGELLLFTDPDIYPDRQWLRQMVSAYESFGGVIVGAMQCHNASWLARGIHYGKFDSWLAGGEPRPIEISLTGNMLVSKAVFERLGGFDGSRMLGDTLFSWCLEREGVEKTFFPAAIVAHDHDESFTAYLGERWRRGREFGLLRANWNQWTGRRVLQHLVVTLLPLRLAKLAWRGYRQASAAGQAGDYVLASPVALAGHAAWLAGEAAGFVAWLLRPSDRERVRCGS